MFFILNCMCFISDIHYYTLAKPTISVFQHKRLYTKYAQAGNSFALMVCIAMLVNVLQIYLGGFLHIICPPLTFFSIASANFSRGWHLCLFLHRITPYLSPIPADENNRIITNPPVHAIKIFANNSLHLPSRGNLSQPSIGPFWQQCTHIVSPWRAFSAIRTQKLLSFWLFAAVIPADIPYLAGIHAVHFPIHPL